MSLFNSVKSLAHNRYVQLGLIVVVVVLITKTVQNNRSADLVVSDTQKPVVSLTTPAIYVGGQSISIIGTVRAFSEADITSEQSGRVTAVTVSLGQAVSAGQIIATLENASERASVLQAEGIYDAAVAGAAQTEIGVDEAKNALANAENNAISIFQSAYNTSNGIVLDSIDDFFANPNYSTPGLRIDGQGYTTILNNERVAYQSLLLEWRAKASAISPNDDIETELDYAKSNVQKTLSFVDTFLTVFGRQGNSSRYSDDEIQGFITEFTGLRSSLINLQTSINNSITDLNSSADAVRRAELASRGSVSSTADAQIKQALGTLRAAQANLAKTILRTPISGTVNSLSVRTGDFIGSFESVAKVANNSALEIVTHVNENERDLFATGDTVLIENSFTGIVTEIAPAVDSETHKIEVRIAAEDLDIVNGDTVTITKESSTELTTDQPVLVPLSAVKFELEDGFIFTLKDDRLVAQTVTLGKVRGGSVEILEGLEYTTEFVIDARGLLADSEVTVSK